MSSYTFNECSPGSLGILENKILTSRDDTFSSPLKSTIITALLIRFTSLPFLAKKKMGTQMKLFGSQYSVLSFSF